ncbi:hypothetical protein AAE02nite_00520 [Adhaeribacter aerolatus]|uniref:Uncharacterized protein n=1 Tax=Adhaeribacter aerolatus TaxID=670289 RepID=A0A512ARQ4_9BACT|nr:hypothetical protein [Adhaeribacter aerolatus]GEO02388.1 hypothetical protein AAE02nite_00520 [Adhaeribacter aerolatus]
MIKHAVVLIFLLTCGALRCWSQVDEISPKPADWSKKYNLVLDKPGKVSRIRFYPGTTLTFKLTDDKRLYTGKLDAVRKKSILIFNTELPIRDIRKVRVVQRAPMGRFLYGLGGGIRGAGSLFTLIGGGNYLLTDDKENGRVTAQAGLALFGLGQLFRGFNRRTYKINQHRQLKTIEII